MTHADAELEEILMEAAIDEVREKGFQRFDIGDTEIAAALDSPAGIQGTTDDKVIIYHTETHDAREIPKVYLRNTLRKKLDNGKRAFSLRPTGEAIKGNVMCYLHPDHPDREKWRQMGIMDSCQSAHFASVVDMEAQMKNRHSRAWARMQEMLDKEDTNRERDWQRAFYERLGTAVGAKAYLCPDCDKSFESGAGLKIHIGREHK